MINRFFELIKLGSDRADEAEIISGIKASISFKGAKLLVLILAIFVASLGLNTNSTAVIIGAMLISPLMGPIIGMGLAVGIADFDMLKRAFKHYIIATIFSILTASTYFLISPIAEVQSELLARTSPTIYDVLIALCGGLAGIIAQCSKSQRTGNVIPGVAIATALMPPLCTVGFFLTKGNMLYALGAFYLFLINTVFIAFATFIGVKVMKFKATEHNALKHSRSMRIITLLVLVVMIPSIFTTVNIVRDTIFRHNANNYINHEVVFSDAEIISRDIDYAEKKITLTLIGNEIDDNVIKSLEDKLAYYKLSDVKLIIRQNTFDIDKIKNNISQNETKLSAEVIALNQKIHDLESQLGKHNARVQLCADITNEIKALYPSIGDVNVSSVNDTTLLVTGTIAAKQTDISTLADWLKVKCQNDSIVMFIK